jgi:hypothetical protein
MKRHFARLATYVGQYMYFMHKIIVTLANHNNPKKFVLNCGMWVYQKIMQDNMMIDTKLRSHVQY